MSGLIESLQHNPWDIYLGDCPVVTKYLNDKPLLSWKWSSIHVINIFLRAVGQPAFVNNPLLGAIILAGLFLFDVKIGAGCILGGVTATITDLLVGLHPAADLNAGVSCFNGVLIGTVIPILYPVFYETEMNLTVWLAVFVGASISVFIAKAFGNFLSKFNVPYMALPFNLTAVCVFLTLQPHNFTPSNDILNGTEILSPNNNETMELSWKGLGQGILVSMGQVYAVKEVTPSIVMNLAVLLSSPLLLLMSTIGATLGTFLSLSFLDETEYDQIYDGLWGYNGLLSMAAVSCVFFPLTVTSFLAGLANVVVTVFVQRALAHNMDTNHLPVFTLPMTLSTLVMLMVSMGQGRRQSCFGVRGQLERCGDMSYPEKQCWSNVIRSRDKQDWDAATTEEKEPTIKIDVK